MSHRATVCIGQNPLHYIESMTLRHIGTGFDTRVISYKDNTPIDILVADIPREWTDEDQQP